jgi:hypothetical protein
MLAIPSLAYFKPLPKRTDDASFISFKGLRIVLLNLLLYRGGLDLSRRALESGNPSLSWANCLLHLEKLEIQSLETLKG